MDHTDTATVETRVLELARALDPDVEAIWIDPELADTTSFCAHYGYALEESGNCILVGAKTGPQRYAACVVQATRQLDLNRQSRLVVDARKASFASADESIARTGMLPGGITPIGLPDDLRVFVDTPIMALERVIVGGGGRRLKLRMRPAALRQLPSLTVAGIGRDIPGRSVTHP